MSGCRTRGRFAGATMNDRKRRRFKRAALFGSRRIERMASAFIAGSGWKCRVGKGRLVEPLALFPAKDLRRMGVIHRGGLGVLRLFDRLGLYKVVVLFVGDFSD